MASEEADTSSKTPKLSSAQERPPSSSPATAFPDWASFQAYYSTAGGSPIPPPGFYHSPVASGPQGHPYMWGAQHIIPPYGTPPHPYVTMYPHGGIYPHPSVPQGSHPYSPYAMASPIVTAEASVSLAGGVEQDGKGNENGKASGASANGDVSESGESGSEGSSEGSDAHSADVSEQKQRNGHGSASGEVQNGITIDNTSIGGKQTHIASAILSHATPFVAIPPSVIPGPTTLNMGMDYWGGSASSVTSSRSKLPVKPAKASCSLPREGVPSDLWLQDEREIKRQRRKQSNRESARRSRLRKQAECEELAQRVGTLKEENDLLTEELQCIREDCKKLASENASLNEAVQKLKGKQLRVDEGPSQLDPNSEVKVEVKVEAAEKSKVEAAEA